jgi:hypothetical protein
VNVKDLLLGATWQYKVDAGNWIDGTGSTFEAADGTHSYKVRQTVNGVTSPDTQTQSFTLDTHAANAGNISGLVPANQYANYTDANPLMMSVALPTDAAVGDVIKIKMSNTLLSTGVITTADLTSLTVTADDLLAGHKDFTVPGSKFSILSQPSFTAQITDLAGNAGAYGYSSDAAPTIKSVSVFSDDLLSAEQASSIQPDAVRVNRAPESPAYHGFDNTTVSHASDDSLNHTLQLNFNANPKTKIHIYDFGTEIGVVTAPLTGNANTGLASLSFAASGLATGQHEFTAKTESNGILSFASEKFTVLIQDDLNLDLGLATSNNQGVLTFDGTNGSTAGTPERYTLDAADLLLTGNVLTFNGNANDTLQVIHAGSDGISGLSFQLKPSDYAIHENGYWKFDVDQNGTIDLMVQDTIHRIAI